MMSAEDDHEGPPNKRRKLELDSTADVGCTSPPNAPEDQTPSSSLGRPISPPPSRRRRSRTPPPSTPRVQADAHVTKQIPLSGPSTAIAVESRAFALAKVKDEKAARYIRSPFQLTKIREMERDQNVDTVALGDILGYPMIKECWNFNFLFDLDFVMNQFDVDVKDSVKVKVVHGFWKREDARRIDILEVAERYPNLEPISAYIPDPFGTHHSKMLILFRRDETAQVIIHTANMIPRDWGNMTQAVWQSPLLPLQPASSTPPNSQLNEDSHPIGSGERFKIDILRYLNEYGKRLDGLTKQLVEYDFSTVRAAFLSSAPSRQNPSAAKRARQTSFGWLGLKEILSTVPVQETHSATPPNIVVQISSIATLGQNPTWLTNFQSALNCTASNAPPSSSSSSFFTKASSLHRPPIKKLDPTHNIIFPTAHEIRTSIDGYASGGSIHTKIQSAAQQKQLDYLRPLLCHWKYYPGDTPLTPRREAYRGPAAPHIKTYIRFSDAERRSVDWAMVTSANLSKQAWGELENKKGEIWIQSWEVGVVVWPALFGEGAASVMVPVFGRDMPGAEDWEGHEESTAEGEKGVGRTVVGLRMPYDLPLSRYGPDEVPWCATLADEELDWKGQAWSGF